MQDKTAFDKPNTMKDDPTMRGIRSRHDSTGRLREKWRHSIPDPAPNS
jgi:hypothetical protein